MNIENTFIEGLKLIELNRFDDIRGSFVKAYNEDFFFQNDLETNFKESYYSISSRDVIRGMHFQIPPFEHTKLVFVNQGAVLDVVLDIRVNSKTYGQFFKIKINQDNPILVYIPIGCAHGYLTLEPYTIVTYLQSSCYDRKSDKGVLYNSFGMDWGIENPIISERDLIFPEFKNTHYIF